MSASESKLPRVCLLASAETSPSVLYGLFDVLSTVGAIYPEMTTGEAGAQLLDVKIVATASKPFRCYGNVMVEPDVAVDDLAETDVAIVCDMYQPIDTPPRGRYRCEIDWIKRMYTGGGRSSLPYVRAQSSSPNPASWMDSRPLGIGPIGRCFAITIPR